MKMQISIKNAQTLKTKPDDSQLAFGTQFTDHMLNIDYAPENGWHNARIEPYHAIRMDPATMVLHYGQAIFEGLKAFRTASGSVQLFRPQENFKRINRSARALCMPEFDEDFLLQSLKELIHLEEKWVPSMEGTSLYIRPTCIAFDPYLGVRASKTYRYFVILSPVGAYYKEGFNPVKILVTKDHVRAVRGGLGEAKTPGNYAASLFAGEMAQNKGYTQVLWLDGVELKYIEEVGSMNIFFVIEDTLITPMLNGSILPGITRDAVIQLGKKWGLSVEERRISIDEVMDAAASGKLQEVFGSGTAAVISPVGELKFGDRIASVGDGKVGPLAKKFFGTITDIQYGKIEDPFGWIETL
jgi:branched-chain amino acid aminotransferase